MSRKMVGVMATPNEATTRNVTTVVTLRVMGERYPEWLRWLDWQEREMVEGRRGILGELGMVSGPLGVENPWDELFRFEGWLIGVGKGLEVGADLEELLVALRRVRKEAIDNPPKCSSCRTVCLTQKTCDECRTRKKKPRTTEGNLTLEEWLFGEWKATECCICHGTRGEFEPAFDGRVFGGLNPLYRAGTRYGVREGVELPGVHPICQTVVGGGLLKHSGAREQARMAIVKGMLKKFKECSCGCGERVESVVDLQHGVYIGKHESGHSVFACLWDSPVKEGLKRLTGFYVRDHLENPPRRVIEPDEISDVPDIPIRPRLKKYHHKKRPTGLTYKKKDKKESDNDW